MGQRGRLNGVRISCREREFSREFREFVTECGKFSSEFLAGTTNSELSMANSELSMANSEQSMANSEPSLADNAHCQLSPVNSPVSLLSVLTPFEMTENLDVQGVLSVCQSQT